MTVGPHQRQFGDRQAFGAHSEASTPIVGRLTPRTSGPNGPRMTRAARVVLSSSLPWRIDIPAPYFLIQPHERSMGCSALRFVKLLPSFVWRRFPIDAQRPCAARVAAEPVAMFSRGSR
jgi:hypothetical protein